MSADKNCIVVENIRVLPLSQRRIPGAVGNKIFYDAQNCLKGDIILRLSVNIIDCRNVEIFTIVDEWIDCLSYFDNYDKVSLTEDFETIAYMYKSELRNLDFYWYEIEGISNEKKIDNYIGSLNIDLFKMSLFKTRRKILEEYRSLL